MEILILPSKKDAEKQMISLIFNYLYKSPAKILEVGIVPDVLSEKLIDKGFTYFGLFKDNKKQNTSFLESFDAYNINVNHDFFDIIIFRDVLDDLEKEILFPKARKLLSDGGRLFFLNDFSEHTLENFINLAVRNGLLLGKKENIKEKTSTYFFMEFKKENNLEKNENLRNKRNVKKKKALILTLIPLNAVGGIEKINQNIADLLRDFNWEVDTVSKEDIKDDALINYLLSTDSALFECLGFTGVLDWKSYDLVITNNNAGGACHPTENTRVVTLSHGVFSGIGKEIECAFPGVFPAHILKLKGVTEEISYSNKSELIAVSQQVHNELLDIFHQESHVVVNGFDFSHFEKTESTIREDYNIPDDALIGIYAGRLDPIQKRSEITIELAKIFPDIFWIFATDKKDPRYDEFKNIIVILNTPYEQMPALYAGANFAIQLSSYEGFSNFALEAIAAKIPVISTKTGIIDEVYMGTALEPLLLEQSMSPQIILERAVEKVVLLKESYAFYKEASEILFSEAREKFSLSRWRDKMVKILKLQR